MGFTSCDVGIVGGRGRMGAWAASRLAKAGARVRVADAADGPLEERFAREADVLLLAVPLDQVEPVMQRLGPHTRQDGVVADLSSLKSRPLVSMLRHARGEVLGLHPLFGPSANGLRGQTVFHSPGRSGPWCRRILAWLNVEGARLVEMEPEAHDRLMARVQTLRHFLLAAFGLALKDLDFGPEEAEMAGPWFQQLLGILEHQCTQPGQLFAKLARHNSHALPAVETLGRALDRLNQTLVQGDEEGLAGLLDEACLGW